MSERAPSGCWLQQQYFVKFLGHIFASFSNTQVHRLRLTVNSKKCILRNFLKPEKFKFIYLFKFKLLFHLGLTKTVGCLIILERICLNLVDFKWCLNLETIFNQQLMKLFLTRRTIKICFKENDKFNSFPKQQWFAFVKTQN